MKVNELSNYQKMTLKLLVDTARKIIAEEGSTSLTIRKVSSMAGYNSGTIYNHFENIEHLRVFAYLQSFDEYIEDIQNYIDEDSSLIDIYFGIWKCFIKHTKLNTEAFYTIFFNSLERSISEYIDEYYSIFPINNAHYGDTINKMLNSSSIRDRNIILLEELCNEGYLKQEDIIMVNDLSAFTYEALLHRMYRGSIDKNEGGKKIYEYITILLNSNLIKN